MENMQKENHEIKENVQKEGIFVTRTISRSGHVHLLYMWILHRWTTGIASHIETLKGELILTNHSLLD